MKEKRWPEGNSTIQTHTVHYTMLWTRNKGPSVPHNILGTALIATAELN
jgi:hypothetical protein